LEESNNSPSNQTAVIILVPKGSPAILATPEIGTPTYPVYPNDLTEIQEVGERLAGTTDSFNRMTRVEYTPTFPPTSALLYWCWEDQTIKFNSTGALTDREIQLRYVRQGVPYVANANTIITMINSRSYLSYKTAALCAMFIGENESRAKILNDQADEAMERLEGISNKGRQQIMTRHRPFRAAYKSRGYI
jgi:hypothetical protein